MPRVARIAPGGIIYHVFNRADGRLRLFQKDADYAAFTTLLAEVHETAPVRVLAYCLMPDHWHLVLWPRRDGDLSKFMLRLTTGHVRRHFASYRRPAAGKLYQGRFKNFPIQENQHLLNVFRYIEANPLRAKLAKRAERWPWSSLHARLNGTGADLLEKWPVKRPANWVEFVNTPASEDELAALRTCVARGRPYGASAWVNRMVDRFGLESTLRPRGRPRKEKDED